VRATSGSLGAEPQSVCEASGAPGEGSRGSGELQEGTEAQRAPGFAVGAPGWGRGVRKQRRGWGEARAEGSEPELSPGWRCGARQR